MILNLEKLYYLNSFISESAAPIVNSLSIIELNYGKALKIFANKCNYKKVLASDLLDAILDAPRCYRES